MAARSNAGMPMRRLLGRPTVPLLGLLALTVGGCAQVGTNNLTFWDVVFSMVIFFFWFMFIWIFIELLADIIRRNDLSGVWKAVWIFVLVILPFLGALIYIATRPKMTAQDVEMMTRAEAAARAASSISVADELAKLQQLKQSGAITEPEYETLKAKAMQGSGV